MEPAAPDLSALCTECGLCCNGALFDRVPVTTAESERLRVIGLPLFPSRDAFAFAPPCVMLAGTCCTIYPDRPARCRDYACALLGRVLAGKVDVARAAGLIAETRAAVDRLAELAPEAVIVTARVPRALAAAQWTKLEDPAAKREGAQVYLAIVAVEKLLDQHFRKPRPDDPRAGAPVADGTVKR